MNKLKISLESLLSAPWAVRQQSLAFIVSSILKHVENNGEIVVDYKEDIKYEKVNGKAIINIEGLFYNKLIIDPDFGYVNLDLEKTLIAAVDDTSVDEVILKIESPGGIVYGVAEIHDLIKDLKKTKPINAYVNGMACSAFYWIPTACTNIYAYMQSDVGSIGVYMLHVDYSQHLKEMGIKVEYIQAGKYKTAGNQYEPLTKESRTYLQEGIDQIYDDFTKTVSDSRNLKIEEQSKWAEGKVFEAREALKLGLIDKIKSWQEMLGYNKGTFSLKERFNMAIGEKKVSELNAEDLQSKNPDLYESIYNIGFKAGETLGKEASEKFINALNEKLKVYEENEQKRADEVKIRNFAKSLNLVEEGEALISENKSVGEAYEILALKVSKITVETQKKFAESAPDSAGGGSDSMADDMPKTASEAIAFVKERDKCSKKEAWRIARKEFWSLFSREKTEE